MRLVAVIVLIALFGALNANKAMFQELNKINKHPFGQTMLAAISTNLRAKTPLSDLGELLNKILADLEADSATLDSTYQQTRDSLRQAIESNGNLVKTNEEQIALLEESIANYEHTGISKTQENKVATENLNAAQSQLRELNEEHAGKTENYDEDIKDLTTAIGYAQEAKAQLATYKSASGASLLQVASAAKSHLTAFSQKMKHLSKKLSKHGANYSPLIHELVQLTQSVQDEQVHQVLNLLDTLIGLLEKALNDLRAESSSYEGNFQNQLDTINSNIAQYQATLDVNAVIVQQVAEQESQAIKDLANAKQNLADAKTALANAHNQNDSNEGNYGKERPRYDHLIAIMKTLIKHFNADVALLDEYTANALNNGASN